MRGPDIDPPRDPIHDRESDRELNCCAPEPVSGGQAGDLPPVSEDISLEELTAQLEYDPDECERAFEGLQAVDEPVREQIVEQLAKISIGPGVLRLLQLLAAAGLGPTSETAARAIETHELRAHGEPMVAASLQEAAKSDAGNRDLLSRPGRIGDSTDKTGHAN